MYKSLKFVQLMHPRERERKYGKSLHRGALFACACVCLRRINKDFFLPSASDRSTDELWLIGNERVARRCAPARRRVLAEYIYARDRLLVILYSRPAKRTYIFFSQFQPYSSSLTRASTRGCNFYLSLSCRALLSELYIYTRVALSSMHIYIYIRCPNKLERRERLLVTIFFFF